MKTYYGQHYSGLQITPHIKEEKKRKIETYDNKFGSVQNL